MRNPKLVVDELEYLWKKYKPNELYFDDDNFAVNEKHAADICREIIRRKLKLKWNCMVDARISEKLLRLMKKSGCTGITIGAESADDIVLKHLGKPITRKGILSTVESCKKLGLRSHVCWVLGMPYSTKESDKDTIKFALSIPSDTLQFSICMPYIGTKMYNWCKEKGYLITNDWSKFSANEKCIVDYPKYSHKDIEELHRYANKMWHRKMIIEKPNIVFFHLYNAYKYNGIRGIMRLAKL